MARSTTDIQADLDAAYASRRAAMLAQTYSLDDLQGKQSVTRASLPDIENSIRNLENELDEASGNGGNYYCTMDRY